MTKKAKQITATRIFDLLTSIELHSDLDVTINYISRTSSISWCIKFNEQDEYSIYEDSVSVGSNSIHDEVKINTIVGRLNSMIKVLEKQ